MLVRFTLCRDDVESVVEDGKSFLSFCPDWQNAALWQEWKQFGIECFTKGQQYFYHHYHILTGHVDPSPSPLQQEQAQTTRTKILICKDTSGRPLIPSTTMSDGYKTKAVQSMLREYCTAHLRKDCIHQLTSIINIH